MSAHAWPERVTAVLFDVGNTLHHLDHDFIAATISAQSHRVTAHDVARAECAAKAAVDAQFLARRARDDADRRFSYFEIILNALRVPTPAMPAIVAALHSEDVRQSLWRVMQPDTPQVIAELRRRGYTLAVVSNADGRVPAALAASGLATHFTAIIDSHLVGVEKPDARIFHMAVEACEVTPAEAIYVGDIYEIDVCGARNAGLTPVLLDPLEYRAAVDCARIGALAELLELLPRAGDSD